MKRLGFKKRRLGRRKKFAKINKIANKLPRNPYGGLLHYQKIEIALDLHVWNSGAFQYYSFSSTALTNIAQAMNQFLPNYAADIRNAFNSYAFYSLNGISINFDRSINLSDSRVKSLPALYIDSLGSMTQNQASNILTRTVCESDNALKVNMMADDVRTHSKYFEYTGNYNTISGTQAFGKGNYMTTDYFPIINILIGQLDSPNVTETLKVGQIRVVFYCTFTKRLAINNFNA